MIISIHQPQYIPWIPYFSKIYQSDVFVFLDDVQYQKNGLQNRNFILCKNGPTRLTIPVSCRFGDKINEAKIADNNILEKHWQTIEQCYKQAKIFSEINPLLQEIYKKDYTLLSELNIEIIKGILSFLSIKTELIKSSEIGKQGTKSDLILYICKHVQADTYLTGSGGLDYLNIEDFRKAGIRIQILKYNFKPYSQHNSGEFVDKLSILDLLFNQGRNSIDYF
jgi:hypothetical protein